MSERLDANPAGEHHTVAWITLAIVAMVTGGAVATGWFVWGRTAAPPKVDHKQPSAPGPDNSVTKAPDNPGPLQKGVQ